jgi:glutamate synthase (NADPH/NADH) small chain
MWQTAPVEILPDARDSARVGALRCVKTELGEPDSSGRRSISTIEGSEFDVPVDIVIKATGQQKMRELLSSISGVELDSSGRVRVDSETMRTGNPKFFAGGDCVNGGREAVDASQMGKLAAQGIHASLSGERVEFAGARVPLAEETQDVKPH